VRTIPCISNRIRLLTANRHCPSGVAEPTYAHSAAPAITSPATGSMTSAPAASASASASHDHDDDDHSHAVTASTCEPHGDHWHCPSGVAEPTTAPAQTLSTSKASTASGAAASGASGSASASLAQATGAASAVGAGQQGIAAIVLGTVGAFFL
jgi:hypothetical protein